MTYDQQYHSTTIKLDREVNELLRQIHEYRQVKKIETIGPEECNMMENLLVAVAEVRLLLD